MKEKGEDMKKSTLRERIEYRFDNLMAKGTIALVGMLFLATALAVILVGAIMLLVNGHASFGENVWIGIMHIIDAGTITAADTSQTSFIILMSVVTLIGLFVTSILIGIITTGFEEKLNNLKKGNSRVIERGHTVILGFDHNVLTLVSELITANESRKDACIVILTEQEKEVVENIINEEFPDKKTTRIICRTGNIADLNMLKKCAIESAHSIIINESEDFLTIKSMLAINTYFKSVGILEKIPHMVTTVTQQANFDACQLISEGNAEVILVQDSISRIIAQTCRQPGLSNVLIELFDYDGDELYFEHCPSLAGISFGDALNYFEKAILFGYKRSGKVYLNPDKEVILEEDDRLLLLVEDDGMAQAVNPPVVDVALLEKNKTVEVQKETILVIGANLLVEKILNELDSFVLSGTVVIIADEVIPENYKQLVATMQNIELELEQCDIGERATLESLMEREVSHVLLVSKEDDDEETADARTLLKLIHLRDIAQKTGKSFSITSEMQNVANQKLAQITKVNDLVVGSNIINLILTQISENRDLANVFRELLQAEGSEIYMRPAGSYVALDTPMNFYCVTEIVRRRNEIAIGYKKQVGSQFEIITNPLKTQEITFTEEDFIITISED